MICCEVNLKLLEIHLLFVDFSAKDVEKEKDRDDLSGWYKVWFEIKYSFSMILIFFRYIKSVEIVKKCACAKVPTCKNARK